MFCPALPSTSFHPLTLGRERERKNKTFYHLALKSSWFSDLKLIFFKSVIRTVMEEIELNLNLITLTSSSLLRVFFVPVETFNLSIGEFSNVELFCIEAAWLLSFTFDCHGKWFSSSA